MGLIVQGQLPGMEEGLNLRGIDYGPWRDGKLVIPVTEREIRLAKEEQGGIKTTRQGDDRGERFTGFLGHIALVRYLTGRGIPAHRLPGYTDGSPAIALNGHGVMIKIAAWKRMFDGSYIPLVHASTINNAKVDEIWFGCYDEGPEEIVMVGGIPLSEFNRVRQPLYPAGSTIYAACGTHSFTAQADDYAVYLHQLTPSEAWLKRMVDDE